MTLSDDWRYVSGMANKPVNRETSARSLPLHVRLSPETYAVVQAEAAAQRRPVATLLSLLIDDWAAGKAVPKPKTGIRS